jgi:hypothetical protein
VLVQEALTGAAVQAERALVHIRAGWCRCRCSRCCRRRRTSRPCRCSGPRLRSCACCAGALVDVGLGHVAAARIPGLQAQVKGLLLFPVGAHVPPFRHGDGEHTSSQRAE